MVVINKKKSPNNLFIWIFLLIFVSQLKTNKSMENMDYILEEGIEVLTIDGKEVEYDMECYDGYAIGKLADDVDAPATIRMEYPKLEDVLKDDDLCYHILKYRGLWDKTAADIHFGDIMMYLGEIV